MLSRLLVILCVILLPATAQATIINLSATMDCAQVNGGVGSCAMGGSGTGTATITLDDATNLLSWNIIWSGLSSPEILQHFHGPSLPSGNAGVQVTVGIASPEVGNMMISPAQAADLLNNLWYLNLHTQAFTGGEIRGQVLVPEAGTLSLIGLALVTAGFFGRRQGRA